MMGEEGDRKLDKKVKKRKGRETVKDEEEGRYFVEQNISLSFLPVCSTGTKVIPILLRLFFNHLSPMSFSSPTPFLFE